MKEKIKRNFWENSEIDCMLGAIRDLQKVQGNTTTTHNTFVQIATKMRRRGFCSKSPTQIRRKWFQMKSAYLCYKRGNKERLLLIPERFRGVIAQFVENEYKLSHKTILSTTNVAPTIAPKMPSKPPTATVKPPPAASPPPRHHMAPSTVTVPPPAHTAKIQQPAQPTPPPPSLPKMEHSKLPTIQKNGSFYQRKLDEFISRLKVSQKLILNDFQKMQETLMDYEHNCQSIRDAQLIAFMTNSEVKT